MADQEETDTLPDASPVDEEAPVEEELFDEEELVEEEEIIEEEGSRDEESNDVEEEKRDIDVLETKDDDREDMESSMKNGTEEESDDWEERRSLAIADKRSVFLKFARDDLTVMTCLRGSNNYIINREGDEFVATAIVAELEHAFAFVSVTAKEDIYQIIHLASGQHLSVRTDDEESEWKLYAVSTDQLSVMDPKELHFTIRGIAEKDDLYSIHLETHILWKNRILTQSEAEDQETHSVVFAIQSEEEQQNEIGNIFVMERPKKQEIDQHFNLLPLLDLVQIPRTEKCRVRELPKYEHLSQDLVVIIKHIFVRLNKEQPRELKHYVHYHAFWNEFVIYCEGSVSRRVITVLDQGATAPLREKEEGDSLMVHITDFLYTLDTVADLYRGDIEMEKMQDEIKKKEDSLASIETHLQNLNPIILTKHPKLEEWHKKSTLQRLIYDWNLWIQSQIIMLADPYTIKLGFMATSLTKIQSHFGQSMFATFQLSRWLLLMNMVITLLFVPLYIFHASTMSWSAYSFSDYFEMLSGNEYEYSLWFYGGYDSEHGTLYIMTCGIALLISVAALLNVLVTFADSGDSTDDLLFIGKVFSEFRHCLNSEQGFKLNWTAMAVDLHESMLERKDEESIKVTNEIITRRVLGIGACICLTAAGFTTIAYLIIYEKDTIIPWLEDLYPESDFYVRLSEYIVPTAVSVLSFVITFAVPRIVATESYSGKQQTQQEFARVLMIRVGFVFFTLFYAGKKGAEVQTEPEQTCVENQLGAMMYRFIETNILMDLFLYILYPNIRYCMTPNGCCNRFRRKNDRNSLSAHFKPIQLSEIHQPQDKEEREEKVDAEESQNRGAIEESVDQLERQPGDSWKLEFDIPGELTELLYRQVIVWSGMYFCPMLPFIGAFSVFIAFHAKWLHLRQFCSRPRRAYGVGRNKNKYYAMLLIGVFLSVFVFNWLLRQKPICGPHQGKKIQSVVEAEILDHTADWVQAVFNELTHPLIIAAVIIMLSARLDYLRRRKNAYKRAHVFANTLIHTDSTGN